jgi:hypothetical protein
MATAKLIRDSGRKLLLIKLRVLQLQATKVRFYSPLPFSRRLISDTSRDGNSISFNTQFFHDDDDDAPSFDGDLAGAADPGEQDPLARTQGKTRRVRPEFIDYTKCAKRVDVHKLKETIWNLMEGP